MSSLFDIDYGVPRVLKAAEETFGADDQMVKKWSAASKVSMSTIRNFKDGFKVKASTYRKLVAPMGLDPVALVRVNGKKVSRAG